MLRGVRPGYPRLGRTWTRGMLYLESLILRPELVEHTGHCMIIPHFFLYSRNKKTKRESERESHALIENRLWHAEPRRYDPGLFPAVFFFPLFRKILSSWFSHWRDAHVRLISLRRIARGHANNYGEKYSSRESEISATYSAHFKRFHPLKSSGKSVNANNAALWRERQYIPREEFEPRIHRLPWGVPESPSFILMINPLLNVEWIFPLLKKIRPSKKKKKKSSVRD